MKLETITAARPFLPEGPESTLTVNLVKTVRDAYQDNFKLAGL